MAQRTDAELSLERLIGEDTSIDPQPMATSFNFPQNAIEQLKTGPDLWEEWNVPGCASKIHMDRKEKWAISLLQKWLKTSVLYESKSIEDILLGSSLGELDQALSYFISEIRQEKKGKRYQLDSLRQMVTSVQRYLRRQGRFVSLMTDPQFTLLQGSLAVESLDFLSFDAQNTKYKVSTPISATLEDQLWEAGGLGVSNPQVLLDTLVYYCGVHFGLISGSQLRSVHFTRSTLILLADEMDQDFVRFTPRTSGSVLSEEACHIDVHKQTILNKTERCLVLLYKLYNSKCSADRPDDALFLQPLSCPTPVLWYTTLPMGKDALGRTLARIAQRAGLDQNQDVLTPQNMRMTCLLNLKEQGCHDSLIRRITGLSKDKITQLSTRSELGIINQQSSVSRTANMKRSVSLERGSRSLKSTKKRTCINAVKASVPVPTMIEGILGELLPSKIKVTYILDCIYTTTSSCGDFKGFIPEFVHKLMEKINVKCDFDIVADNRYGYQQEDGTWSGLIGELSRKRTDLACAALTITSSRESLVDFTFPFMHSTMAVVFRRPPPHLPPINSLQQLLNTQVQFTMLNGATRSYLTNSKIPVFQQIIARRAEPDPLDMRQALLNVFSKNEALICSRDYAVKFVNWYPDDLQMIDTHYMTTSYALATPKHSPLTKALGRAILQMVEEGCMDLLLDQWWADNKDIKCFQ